jgi:exonuclease SbcD
VAPRRAYDAPMPATVLCVGDIHLGRRPTRLPDDLRDHGVEPADLTPVAAWKRTVRFALEQEVDAVLLAGDVVEGIRDRFEAYSHLESGVRALAEAGIPVAGVAGNHDVEALPRLAARLPGFRLLGAQGEWEAWELETRDGGRLRVLGWSFPSQRVRHSPIADLTGDHDDGIPTLGLLHCDVDGGSSAYAPVPAAAFQTAPGDAWLLGHIHTPGTLGGPRPVGYLGSLVGLDPGEPGRRGPWLARIGGPGDVAMEHIPLAPLRWEREDVPLDDLDLAEGDDVAEAIQTEVLRAMGRVHDRIADELGHALAVGCRLTFTGRTSHHGALRSSDLLRGLGRLTDSRGETHFFVEKVRDEAAQAHDLEDLARGSDPAALLACRLILLEAGSPDAEPLIAKASREMARVAGNASRWGGSDDDLPLPDARAELLRAGHQALDDLLAQRPAPPTDGT